MLPLLYENSLTTLTSRSHPGALGGIGRQGSWGMDRHKDRGLTSRSGRAKALVDNRGLRSDPDEFKPVDSWGKREGSEGPRAQTKAGSAGAPERRSAPEAGPRFGLFSESIRLAKVPMGRADTGRSFEAAFWDLPESPSGPDVDAPAWIPVEKSRLFLSPSQNISSPSISEDIKKNSKVWGLRKRSCSRTKRVLHFTPELVEAGRKEGFV